MSRGSSMPSRSTSSPAALSASQNSAHAAPDTTFSTTSSTMTAPHSEAFTVGGESLLHRGGVEPELERVRVMPSPTVLWVVGQPRPHRLLGLVGERPIQPVVDHGHRRHRVAHHVTHVDV